MQKGGGGLKGRPIRCMDAAFLIRKEEDTESQIKATAVSDIRECIKK